MVVLVTLPLLILKHLSSVTPLIHAPLNNNSITLTDRYMCVYTSIIFTELMLFLSFGVFHQHHLQQLTLLHWVEQCTH